MKFDCWLCLEEADNPFHVIFHINYCCIFFNPQSIAINMKDSKGVKLIKEVGFDSIRVVLFCIVLILSSKN